MRSEIPIRLQLEQFLHSVDKPGRYIGGEPNSVIKNRAAISTDIALVFPDVYEMGMSHTGLKLLYHVINREPDLYAERCFAPMPDMAKMLRQRHIPLYSLETYRPLDQFNTVGISLQTELNFTNVPYVLELGGITPFSRDRTEQSPFIIGGGPCVSNPEPVADFFDFFVIGDGEVLIVSILRTIAKGKRDGKSRNEILIDLSRMTGIYVPKFLTTESNSENEVVPQHFGSKGPYSSAGTIKRVWSESLMAENHPLAYPVPNVPLVHQRFAVEIMRGCTNGCRFCHGGYWYRPVREMSPDDIVTTAERGIQASGERELGLLSLSTSEYSRINELLDYLLEEEAFNCTSIAVPSLRADSLDSQLVSKLCAAKPGAGATMAPETGSERLRRILNKPITNNEIRRAVKYFFEVGYRRVKLYLMVGLPCETLEDLESTCTLISELMAIAQKFSNRRTIHVNIGIMVPKPVTPMQWEPFIKREEAVKKIQIIAGRFRKTPHVRVTWADWNQACVEAVLARGDRSTSQMIYQAYEAGEIFQTFTENFNYSRWEQIWLESGFNLERYFTARPISASLPWDHIHAGVSREYLEREHAGMYSENISVTTDCRKSGCQNCGIDRKMNDLRMAESFKKRLKPLQQRLESVAVGNNRTTSHSLHFYMIIMEKTNLARFISHHIFLYSLEYAFRRLGISLKTNGKFSFKPSIKNPGALPLGLESRNELFLVELLKPLEGDDWPTKLSALMPAGIRVTGISKADSGKFPKIDSVVYTVTLPEDSELNTKELEFAHLTMNCQRKGTVFRLSDEIIGFKLNQRVLKLEIRANECGGSLNPFLVLSALTQTPEDVVRTWRICKNEVRLRKPKFDVRGFA